MSQIGSIKKAVHDRRGNRRGEGIASRSRASKFDDATMKRQEKEMKGLASRAMYMSCGQDRGAVVFCSFVFLVRVLRGILTQAVKISVPESVVVQEISPAQVAAAQGYRFLRA